MNFHHLLIYISQLPSPVESILVVILDTTQACKELKYSNREPRPTIELSWTFIEWMNVAIIVIKLRNSKMWDLSCQIPRYMSNTEVGMEWAAWRLQGTERQSFKAMQPRDDSHSLNRIITRSQRGVQGSGAC